MHPPTYQVPPPPGYMPYDYTSTPSKPSNGYYAPRYQTYTPTPPKKHLRRASHEPTSYSYGSPPPPMYQPQPIYSSAPQYATTYTSPKRDYVSGTARMREKARGNTTYDGTKQQQRSPQSKHTSSRSQHFTVHVADYDDAYYSPDGSPPPPYPAHKNSQSFDWENALREVEHLKYSNAPVYRTPPQRSRSRSHPTPPPRSKTAPAPRTLPPKATAEDAARAGIPAGYSYKNWDPTEEPILLLGSVFDANSLGKWIYDWTVYHHGPSTPMADLAGELWLLLIQLAGKVKRAEECLPRIRHPEDQDLVEEFLESGERLQKRFNKILKICEDFMWDAAKKESRAKKAASPTMGPKSGSEFVEAMFGRDRKLRDTEKLMTSMRLWSMRFDANCEDILRHPSG